MRKEAKNYISAKHNVLGVIRTKSNIILRQNGFVRSNIADFENAEWRSEHNRDEALENPGKIMKRGYLINELGRGHAWIDIRMSYVQFLQAQRFFDARLAKYLKKAKYVSGATFEYELEDGPFDMFEASIKIFCETNRNGAVNQDEAIEEATRFADIISKEISEHVKEFW
jgi:hypothetical protein